MTGWWAQPTHATRIHFFTAKDQPSACGKWMAPKEAHTRPRAKCVACRKADK